MQPLREFIAQEIANDQLCGGPDIITKEEERAIMKGAMLIENDGDEEMANALRQLAIDLGKHHLVFFHGTGLRIRVDEYYLHCADVVIKAYHKWLRDMQRLSALVPSNPSDDLPPASGGPVNRVVGGPK